MFSQKKCVHGDNGEMIDRGLPLADMCVQGIKILPVKKGDI